MTRTSKGPAGDQRVGLATRRKDGASVRPVELREPGWHMPEPPAAVEAATSQSVAFSSVPCHGAAPASVSLPAA